MINNAIAFLFEKIRYELAGVEVDRTKSVGITTIRTVLSASKQDIVSMQNAGWVAPTANELTPVSYTHLDVYKRQPQYCG